MTVKTAYRHLLFLLLFGTAQKSFATWSIIVADSATKMIGMAGASCTPSVYGIGAIAPGKGAIIVQAYSNALAKLAGFNMIMKDATAPEVMRKIREENFNPELQQYAVLCLNDIGHPLTYSGKENTSAVFTKTGYGISVQGNTLVSTAVVEAAYDAALKAKQAGLPLQEILMLAMEAGAKAGGDKRCGERKASSAFLTVSKPGETDHHWLNIVVRQKDDTSPAIDRLRKEYENWKMGQKQVAQNE